MLIIRGTTSKEGADAAQQILSICIGISLLIASAGLAIAAILYAIR